MHTMIISYETAGYSDADDDDSFKDNIIKKNLRTKAYEIIRNIKIGNLMRWTKGCISENEVNQRRGGADVFAPLSPMGN